VDKETIGYFADIPEEELLSMFGSNVRRPLSKRIRMGLVELFRRYIDTWA